MTSSTLFEESPFKEEILALAQRVQDEANSGGEEEAVAEAVTEATKNLEAALEKAGLPKGYFRRGDDQGEIPDEDEILIGDRVCRYRVRSHVMEIFKAAPASLCQALIGRANFLKRWQDSTQVRGGSASYVSEGRTSSFQTIKKPAFPEEMIGALRDVLHTGARFYGCWSKHYVYGGDRDWELIRYEPGQIFSPHVDAIIGSRWQQRQLSVILYLNDEFEGGGTHFPPPGPGITVEPEAGKLVLFPPFYTHPHEGLPPAEGTKYAVLGWFYP